MGRFLDHPGQLAELHGSLLVAEHVHASGQGDQTWWLVSQRRAGLLFSDDRVADLLELLQPDTVERASDLTRFEVGQARLGDPIRIGADGRHRCDDVSHPQGALALVGEFLQEGVDVQQHLGHVDHAWLVGRK